MIFVCSVKLFKPRGKSEKSGRETLKLPVENHETKNFQRQFEQNFHNFAHQRHKLPVANCEKVPMKNLNCLWQIMNSKSCTGLKMFHGAKKRLLQNCVQASGRKL